MAEVPQEIQKVGVFTKDRVDGELSQKVLDTFNGRGASMLEMSEFMQEVQKVKLPGEQKNMQMAATAPGYVYNGHSSQSLSAGAVSSQRPLVELSEVEAARTCAVKVYANSATTAAPFVTSEVKARLLVLFSVQYYLFLR